MKKSLMGLMIFLSVGVSGYAFSFFFLEHGQNPIFKHFTDDLWVGITHVYGGAIALLVGCWQFLPGFRQKNLKIHRILGLVYFISIMIGGFGGFFAAIEASGSLITRIGFTFLDIFWLGSTIYAYFLILKKDYIQHRNWMIRSFAFTFAAVTLRLQFPLWLRVFDLPFPQAYEIISWACWVPNIIVAEWIIRNVNMEEV